MWEQRGRHPVVLATWNVPSQGSASGHLLPWGPFEPYVELVEVVEPLPGVAGLPAGGEQVQGAAHREGQVTLQAGGQAGGGGGVLGAGRGLLVEAGDAGQGEGSLHFVSMRTFLLWPMAAMSGLGQNWPFSWR